MISLTSNKSIQMYRLDNNALSKSDAATALAEAIQQMSSLKGLS